MSSQDSKIIFLHGSRIFWLKVLVQELLEKSRTKLGYDMDRQVGFKSNVLKKLGVNLQPPFQLLAVLEEDGTEVEEDDYFQVPTFYSS